MTVDEPVIIGTANGSWELRWGLSWIIGEVKQTFRSLLAGTVHSFSEVTYSHNIIIINLSISQYVDHGKQGIWTPAKTKHCHHYGNLQIEKKTTISQNIILFFLKSLILNLKYILYSLWGPQLFFFLISHYLQFYVWLSNV